MNTMNFMDIISNSFNKIRDNFTLGLKSHGYDFDEDIFIDTLLRCSCALKDHIMTEQEAIKYYWVAYLNNLRKSKSKPIEESLDECEIYLLDESYNEDMDRLYDYIMKSISNKFGEQIMMAWKLHVCTGLSYKELRKQGFDMNFNYTFKRITRFIKNHLVKNQMFIELLASVRDE